MPQRPAFDSMAITPKDMRVSRDRLLKLAEFLEALPRKRFDYGTFVGEGYKGAQDLSCGTTACALGWAATMPAFRRLGLHLELDKDYWGTDDDGVELFDASPAVGGVTDTAAGQVIFLLTLRQSSFLFMPSVQYGTPPRNAPECEATPKQVAKHIRRFIKDYREPGCDPYSLDDRDRPSIPFQPEAKQAEAR